MDLSKFDQPFHPDDIEWRIMNSGLSIKGKPWALVLAYVSNRAIMNRLDEVAGKANWQNLFEPAPDGGILCGLSIKIDDKWITKYDGAENTDYEPIKGGLSSSMKRAAVHWGMGRYLYKLKSTFADIHTSGSFKGVAVDKSTKEKIRFSWDPPDLPDFALPADYKENKKTKTNPIVGTSQPEKPSDTPSSKAQTTDDPPDQPKLTKKPLTDYTKEELLKMIKDKMVPAIDPWDYDMFKKDKLGVRSLWDLNKDDLAGFGTGLMEKFRKEIQAWRQKS